MARVTKKQTARGRPRLGDYRLDCMVPRAVLDALKQREKETGQYRTRIAANILCNWQRKGARLPSSNSFVA